MLNRYYPEDVARILLSQLETKYPQRVWGEAVMLAQEDGYVTALRGVALAFGFDIGESIEDMADELRRRSRTFAT